MTATPYPDTITVEVMSELEPIVPEYLENRKKECLLIGGLLEGEDLGEIRFLGHRMKGAGGSFGFDDISEIGEAIELAAMAGDKTAIGSAVMQLSDYLERVVVVYV